MMDKLKFVLFSIVTLGLLGIIGYWAVITLKPGGEFKDEQKISELQTQNDDLQKQVTTLTSEIDVLQSQIATTTATTSTPPTNTPVSTPPKSTGTTTTNTNTYKNQDLINQLQKLSSNGTTMKLKSSGTSVGSVQKFLNLYFKTSNKIDNDYGKSTQSSVAAFQKDQSLKADGNAGPTTFNKMVAWLKKQG